MRIYALYVIVVVLSVYAWRNWFASLCGLIVIAAFLERKDMPKAVMGIPGLNVWNLLIVVILLAWLLRRSTEGIRWDVPRQLAIPLALYFGVVFVAFLRGVMDLDSAPPEARYTPYGFTVDMLLNPLKYVIPGILLFDGCRTRRRLMIGTICALTIGFLYSVLVIRTMPLGALAGHGNYMTLRFRIQRDVGLNPIDMSTVLAGSFWAMLAATRLYEGRKWRAGLIAAAGVVALGVALCFSRGGYIAFALVGLLLGLLRWRWLLATIPLVAIGVAVFAPTVPERMMMGMGIIDASGEETMDMATVSGGRTTDLWPPVIEQIEKSPVAGFGRRAMLRTEVYHEVKQKTGACPVHPHNAYLEVLLDSGAIGLVIVLLFYFRILWMAMRLFRDRTDPLYSALGGAALAYLAALMIAGLGSQTFFPSVSMLPMWCTLGLLARAWQMRETGALHGAAIDDGVRYPIATSEAEGAHRVATGES